MSAEAKPQEKMHIEVNTSDFQSLMSLAANAVEEAKLHVLGPNYDPDEDTIFQSTEGDGDDNLPPFPEELENGGLFFDQVDEPNISFLSGIFPTTVFSQFNVSDGRTTFAVKCGRVATILSNCDDETVELRLNDQGRLEFDSEDFFYEYGLIQPDAVTGGTRPQLDYDVEFECTVGDIGGALTATGMVADHLIIEIREDAGMYEVVGKAKGDTDEVEKRIAVINHTDVVELESIFGSKFIKKFTDKLAGDTTLSVEMIDGKSHPADMDNFPIHMEANMLGQGRVTFMAAPRTSGV